MSLIADTLPDLPPMEEWIRDNLCEIDAMEEMLKEPLSDNPAELVKQLTKAEAWYGRATKLLADANAYLDLAEHRELMTIDREMKVLERETALKAMVVKERRLRDILQGLTESLKNRGILGMSLRRQAAGEKHNW